jgi:hypothetical protein
MPDRIYIGYSSQVFYRTLIYVLYVATTRIRPTFSFCYPNNHRGLDRLW